MIKRSLHIRRRVSIECYNNLTCYTKDGIDPNTYYLYVCYDVKFKDIDTMAPD